VIDILSTSVAMRRPLEDQARIHNMKRQLSDMRKVQPI
jgi:RpiR family carbohydrate utilization transcriptional regulator